MKVSIAVCVFNEEKNLDDFFNSLRNQSYKDFDIVIVDDGSTDKTIEKIRSYINKLKIILIRLNHVGLREARKVAVNKSKGEIIITFDADEIIDKDCIKNLLKEFEDKNVWAVGGRIKSYGDGLLIRGQSIIQDLSFNSRLRDSYWLSGGCIAYRREALKKIGGLSTGQIGEDVDASWKIKSLGKKIKLLDNAVCLHKDPKSFKKVFNREFNIGSRAKRLFFSHKKNLFDFRFLYRFTTVIFILLLFLSFRISLIYFIITFFLFLFKARKLNYNLSDKVYAWFLLNIINIAWFSGFIKSIFKDKK